MSKYKVVPIYPSRNIEDAIGRARNLSASEIWEDALAAVSETPDITQLVDALEQVISAAPNRGPLWYRSEQIVEARNALAAYRKHVGES